jgi:hypothetical protein
MPPMDKYDKRSSDTPLSEEVEENYFLENEYIREQNSKLDLHLNN